MLKIDFQKLTYLLSFLLIFIFQTSICVANNALNKEKYEELETLTIDCEEGIEQDVILSTQEQIDNFVTYYGCTNCSTIKGNLHISGKDITDLSGLSFITRVEGSLELTKCPNLNSLQGLGNLSRIGKNLKINNMDGLISLNGLSSRINIVYYDLIIRHNDKLEDISRLSNIDFIDRSLLISNNPSLKSLNGLNNLQFVIKRIVIEDNIQLSDGSALCKLFEWSNHEGISLSGNKAGCNTPVQILKSCNAYPTNCGNKADFTFKVDDRLDENHRNKIIFEATPVIKDALYLWKFGDGTYQFNKNVPSIAHYFSTNSEFKVHLKIIGSCTSGITKTVKLALPKFNENTKESCNDGFDNDNDGLADEADPDCACLRGLDFDVSFDYEVAGNLVTLKNTSSVDVTLMGTDRVFGPQFHGVVILDGAGSYNLCMIGRNTCGVEKTFCQTIIIGSTCDEFTQPLQSRSAIPLENKTNTELLQTLGTVRPNPTVGNLTLDFNLSKPTPVSMQLTSIAGQQMAVYLNQVPYESGKHQIEVSLANFPSGIYFLQIQTKDALWVEKIVKTDRR